MPSTQHRWNSVYTSVLSRTKDSAKARNTANQVVLGVSPGGTTRVDALYVPGNEGFKLSAAATSARGAIFTKRILPAGKYKHPGTGRVLDFPANEHAAFAEECNKFIRDGNQCAFTNEHDGKPDANFGWWLAEFSIEDAPDPADPTRMVPWIVGRAEVRAKDLIEKLSDGRIKYVSPGIRYDFEDSTGRKYGRHFFHVAATNTPVIPGQAGFERVELSVGDTRRVFAINKFNFSGEKRMSYKKIALAVGLAENASEDDILSTLGEQSDPKLKSAIASVEAVNKRLQDDLAKERKIRHAEFVLSVVDKATAHGMPLDAEQKTQIESLLSVGQEDAAKAVAKSFLSVSEKLGKKPANLSTVAHTEGAGAGKPQREPKERAKAELLSAKAQAEASGLKVKIEGDELVLVD